MGRGLRAKRPELEVVVSGVVVVLPTPDNGLSAAALPSYTVAFLPSFPNSQIFSFFIFFFNLRKLEIWETLGMGN